MVIDAKITGITYKPFLCSDLPLFKFDDLDQALNENSSFLLQTDENIVAVSTWVSPKRTRSYPYARVYNTLKHSGKKLTIIPFVKDEGKDGDRDFIQWDTIALMSLLGVNVIIAYYGVAVKNKNYKNKITNQCFDSEFVGSKIQDLLSYQSDALHWNIEQINNISFAAELSKHFYKEISIKTGVELHSDEGINKRVSLIKNSKNDFMQLSRDNAKAAQQREINTIQPKEYVEEGIKAKINITNYLGGTYYFTCDEAKIENDCVLIIEGKHTKEKKLPSLDDIKDGIVKMILYSNFKTVKINKNNYTAIPVLKLTSSNTKTENIDAKDDKTIDLLLQEAKANKFRVELPQGCKKCSA
ncbi:MAG: hypothetical protein Ta2B_24730 [Termitinemataceae bacterium]|nr:MAG: hypothetical protein Ta2B_24730 [Termitinemataceae bacterium]